MSSSLPANPTKRKAPPAPPASSNNPPAKTQRALSRNAACASLTTVGPISAPTLAPVRPWQLFRVVAVSSSESDGQPRWPPDYTTFAAPTDIGNSMRPQRFLTNGLREWSGRHPSVAQPAASQFDGELGPLNRLEFWGDGELKQDIKFLVYDLPAKLSADEHAFIYGRLASNRYFRCWAIGKGWVQDLKLAKSNEHQRTGPTSKVPADHYESRYAAHLLFRPKNELSLSRRINRRQLCYYVDVHLPALWAELERTDPCPSLFVRPDLRPDSWKVLRQVRGLFKALCEWALSHGRSLKVGWIVAMIEGHESYIARISVGTKELGRGYEACQSKDIARDQASHRIISQWSLTLPPPSRFDFATIHEAAQADAEEEEAPDA